MRKDITIAYHLGAPCTDNGQLIASLRQNHARLSDSGILVQRPKIYLTLLSEMIKKLEGGKASALEQEKLIEAIVGNQEIDRLILSSQNFMGVAGWMLFGGGLYIRAAKNIRNICNIFPKNKCELFLGIANPASFIPTAFNQQKKDYYEFMDGVDLASVRWSDVLASIQRENPDCKITVWCNEDTPLIWPDVMTAIAPQNPPAKLRGDLDIINSIMSGDGIEELAKSLNDNPNLTASEQRQIKGEVLEKHHLSEAVDVTIDLPGWTSKTVDSLTKIYDEDVEKIEQMSGVTFLS